MTHRNSRSAYSAAEVIEALTQHIQIDPEGIVLDLDKSRGAYLYDRATERFYLDCNSHFASLPLGYNHPDFCTPAFEKQLLSAARMKIANPDFYSEIYAKFVDTFARVAAGERYPHFFLIDGGALAVENALKCAMDWKVRRNIRGGRGERGNEILHFKQAFHGRSGYTLSLTNTHDPNKHQFFAKFPWPRVSNPKIDFSGAPGNPAAAARTVQAEAQAREEIDRILASKAEDIAAIIIEPVQGEGGDNHFRPEFFAYLRAVCDQHDILLIFDEVQTGFGLTGTFWAAEQTGVWPDLIAFGKKSQVCGFMASRRIDEEPQNVFTVPSRISSTFGGTLPDMLRSTKILEVIERDALVANAKARGAELLAGLQAIALDAAQLAAAAAVSGKEHRRVAEISGVRGKGLMVAFDLPTPAARKAFLAALKLHGLVGLGCGERTVRFRPHLNITAAQIEEILRVVRTVALGTPQTSGIAPAPGKARKRKKTGGYGNVA